MGTFLKSTFKNCNFTPKDEHDNKIIFRKCTFDVGCKIDFTKPGLKFDECTFTPKFVKELQGDKGYESFMALNFKEKDGDDISGYKITTDNVTGKAVNRASVEPLIDVSTMTR